MARCESHHGDPMNTIAIIDSDYAPAVIELDFESSTIQVDPSGIQGPSGRDGSSNTRTIEFTVAQNGDLSIDVAYLRSGSWSALFVNGIRQLPSSYSMTGTILTVPSAIIWPGAVCIFEFYPVI